MSWLVMIRTLTSILIRYSSELFYAYRHRDKSGKALVIGSFICALVAPSNVLGSTITPPMNFGRVTTGFNSGEGTYTATICATSGSASFTIDSISIIGADPGD